MAMLLSRSTLAKFPVFRKKWPFIRSKGIHIGFFSSNSKSAPQIDPCAKFQPDWTKDKGSLNFDLEWYRKLLDDAYLPHSDDVSKIITDFERFCSRVPSCQFWW